MKKYIDKGLTKLAKKLDVEFSFTVANHNFELGLPLENSLKHFFRQYFPSRYGFGSGYLVDINDDVSNQCDWIIFDSVNFPPLIGRAHVEDGVEFFPYDSAFAVVEVKRTLKPDSLAKALDQIAKTKSLRRITSSPGNVSPLLDIGSALTKDVSIIETNHLVSGIYAYAIEDIGSATDVIATLKARDFETLPDFIAVHGHYFVLKTQCYQTPQKIDAHRITNMAQQLNGFSWIDSKEETSAVFYAYLLNRLNNMYLSASEYMGALSNVVGSFGIKDCELAPKKLKIKYDKEVD